MIGMKTVRLGTFGLTAVIVAACASGGTIRTESITEFGPDGTENIRETTTVDGRVIETLTQEWQADTLVADGFAPVVERYANAERNRMLAREGAMAMAQVELARIIGETEVTQNTTVNDYATSVVAQTRLRAVLRGSFVIIERFNEADNRYEVTIGLPKANLLRVVREAIR